MRLFYKILNRLNLLKHINVTTHISTNTKSFRIPLINGLGVENLNLKSSWLEHLLSNYKNERDALIFLDIGVNIGQTLLSIKSLNNSWKYFGFEPNANCVYYVNKLIKANRFKNATILPFAISDKIAAIDLYSNHSTDSTATILETFRPNHYNNGYKAQIISFDLDTLVTRLKIEHIDIIKIDIEGSELLALHGAVSVIKQHNPLIICEVLDTHSSNTLENHKIKLKSLELLLKDVDYKIYQILRNEQDTEVTECKHIETFEIKIWDSASSKVNDYLFVPNKDLNISKDKFNLLD